MSELTKYQRELMEHTVSDPGRNWFGTGKNGKDCEEFFKLIELGYAEVRDAPSWSGDDYLFYLTDKGKEALNDH